MTGASRPSDADRPAASQSGDVLAGGELPAAGSGTAEQHAADDQGAAVQGHAAGHLGAADAATDDGERVTEEDRFAELLGAYDEALAGRTTFAANRGPVEDIGPELGARLARAANCLKRLHRLRQVYGSGMIPPADGLQDGDSPVAGEGPFSPRRFGRFELLEELGRGGCGVVYLARDPALERTVALKVPRPDVLVSPELRRRFVREAKAAAALSHPNLVAVHETGQVGPVCWIAEEYCQGKVLAERLRDRDHPIQPETAARLVAELADGLEYAHQHGVLHRDIKPSNVILAPVARNEPQRTTTGNDDDLVEVTPRLTDFGLAKLMDCDGSETRTGVMLGTPAYMAPEQADPKYGPVGPATDVYGLGTILYELLTGQPPLRGATSTDTLRQVLLEDPVPPTRLRRGLAKDLEAICLKCLEKSPPRRYATAGGLAADLRRFLAGHATHARPLGPAGKAIKWSRRHPTAVAALVVTATLLSVILIGGSWQMAQLKRSAATNSRLYRQTVGQQKRQRREQYLSDIRLADRLWRENKLAQARELLARYLPAGVASAAADRRAAAAGDTAGQATAEAVEGLRDFAWHYLWQRCHSELTTYRGHTGDVCALAYAPDGQTIATGGADGTVRLFATRSGRELAVLRGHEGDVNSVVFTPDGRILASAADDTTIRLWDVKTARTLAVLRGHVDDVLCLAMAPDGKTLVSGGMDGTIRRWDVRQRTLTEVCDAHPDWVRAVALSPDGHMLASVSDDGTLKLWDVHKKLRLRTTVKHGSWVMALAFGPKGKLVATGTRDHRIGLWDAQTGKSVAKLNTERGWIRSVAFSPNGSYLAAVGNNDVIRLWSLDNPAEPKLVRTIPGHTGEKIWQMAFAPDGRTMATAGDDGVARRWRVGDDPYWDELWELRQRSADLADICVSADGQMIAVGTVGGGPKSEVEVWLRDRHAPVATHAFARQVRGLALLPNARGLVYSGDSHGVTRVDRLAIDGSEGVQSLGETPAVRRPYGDVAIDPTSMTLAVVYGGRAVWLYDLVKGTSRLVELTSDDNEFDAVRFAPDGRSLAAHDYSERYVAIYDLAAGTLRATLPNSECGLAYSPDGRLLATGAPDRSILIWDVTTGQLVRRLAGHDAFVHLVVFSPDGKVLATACQGGSAIKIWATDSATELLTIPSPFQRVTALAFAPDGKALIAGGKQPKRIDGTESSVPTVAIFSAGDPRSRGERFVFRSGDR